MSDTRREDMENRLTSAAAAADAVVATWPSPDDHVRPTLHTRRHRIADRSTLCAAAAAVIAVLALFAALTQLHPARRSSTPAGPGSPTMSSTDIAATASDLQPASSAPTDRAIEVLRETIPVRHVEHIWRTDGSYAVAGQYWNHGRYVATITVSVASASGPLTNPCTPRPGQIPGRSGAPSPDDTCRHYRGPSGLPVWFWDRGHSPRRPTTTAHTIDWELQYDRGDHAAIRVDVDNAIADSTTDPPKYSTQALDLPTSTLISLVTSPHLPPAGRCTAQCLEPADPTTTPR